MVIGSNERIQKSKKEQSVMFFCLNKASIALKGLSSFFQFSCNGDIENYHL